MTLNIAHRGASAYMPENTMGAFEWAIQIGCDAIETDVQMTSDGVLVLIHDEKVERTTGGTGFVKDYTYEELRKLDAGSYYDPKFYEQKIPAAEELLLLAKDKGIKINFELKNSIITYPHIEEKIIELIHKYKMEKSIILSSFNHYSMVQCKTLCPGIPVGLLYDAWLYKPADYCIAADCDAIHPEYHSLSKTIIREAKEKNIRVNSYTVNEVDKMRELLSYSIDGIITNYPDKLRELTRGE